MKKVLITGGAGFIAHHIIAHIIKNTDWEIVTIDRLDISGNLNRLHEILEQFSISEKKRLKIVFDGDYNIFYPSLRTKTTTT